MGGMGVPALDTGNYLVRKLNSVHNVLSKISFSHVTFFSWGIYLKSMSRGLQKLKNSPLEHLGSLWGDSGSVEHRSLLKALSLKVSYLSHLVGRLDHLGCTASKLFALF